MDLKISKKTDVSFTCIAKNLEQTLGKALSSTTGTPTCVLLCSNKKLYVSAISDETFALLVVPNSETSDTGTVAINASLLSGVIKGRATLTFWVKERTLEFKAVKGKYSGKIEINQLEDEKFDLIKTNLERDEKATPIELDSESITMMKKGIALTSIHDVYKVDNVLLKYILINGKKVSISTNDNYHFGIFESKVKSKQDLKLAVLASYFGIVDKLAEEEPVTFHLGGTRVQVESKDFLVNFPASQTEEVNFTLVAEYLKGLPKPTASFEMEIEKISTVTANLAVLASPNTTYELNYSSSNKVLKVTLNSVRGKASDSFKVTPIEGKDVSCRIEPKLFLDIMSVLKAGKTETYIYRDKSIVFKQVTDTYSITLVGSLV